WQPNYLTAGPGTSPYARVGATSAAPQSPAEAAPVRAANAQAPAPHVPVPAQSAPAPLPASIAGGHAPDYRWVVGHLEHDAAPGRWSVRYAAASVTAEDGGALELVGMHPEVGLKAGQPVRVEGERLYSTGEGSGPAYRVTTITATDGAPRK